jgi:hypothetical protein
LKARGFDVDSVELVKARTGLRAVIASDLAIIIATVVAITLGPESGELTPLLTSAFTAITAITTAYFGIKAVSNTAATAMRKRDEDIPKNKDPNDAGEPVTPLSNPTSPEPPEADQS